MVSPRPVSGAPASKIKAVLFDAFPVFDPRPVFALADRLYPGKGNELSNAWRTRQFEYTWLRTASHRYADFWQVTEDALVFAAKKLKLNLRRDERTRLMNAYLELKAWPDVPPALKALKGSGLKLGFLSNFTPKMLDACLKAAGLGHEFDHVLSTDAARTFKPDPRAYQIGVDALNLRPEEVLFAAFAGWDAAGAQWSGYPTFWVNRLNQPAEELGTVPAAVGKGLADLVSHLGLSAAK